MTELSICGIKVFSYKLAKERNEQLEIIKAFVIGIRRGHRQLFNSGMKTEFGNGLLWTCECILDKINEIKRRGW